MEYGLVISSIIFSINLWYKLIHTFTHVQCRAPIHLHQNTYAYIYILAYYIFSYFNVIRVLDSLCGSLINHVYISAISLLVIFISANITKAYSFYNISMKRRLFICLYVLMQLRQSHRFVFELATCTEALHLYAHRIQNSCTFCQIFSFVGLN